MRLKNLIRDYSKEKKIPYKVAFLVIMGTWKEMYDQMTAMDKYNLRMPGLGTYKLRTWKAEGLENKVRQEMEEEPHIDRTQDIEKLQRVQQMDKEEKERQYAHWEKRKIYKLNKLHNESKGETPTSMEE
jgi:hypothetical protein